MAPHKGSRLHDLDEGERKALDKLKRVIDLFRTIEPRMPTSYMDAFVCVARKPGMGPTDYAKDLNTIQPVASRLLMEIGSFAREREKSLGLVDRQLSPTSAAKHEFFLTPDGKRLMGQVVSILNNGE